MLLVKIPVKAVSDDEVFGDTNVELRNIIDSVTVIGMFLRSKASFWRFMAGTLLVDSFSMSRFRIRSALSKYASSSIIILIVIMFRD